MWRRRLRLSGVMKRLPLPFASVRTLATRCARSPRSLLRARGAAAAKAPRWSRDVLVVDGEEAAERRQNTQELKLHIQEALTGGLCGDLRLSSQHVRIDEVGSRVYGGDDAGSSGLDLAVRLHGGEASGGHVNAATLPYFIVDKLRQAGLQKLTFGRRGALPSPTIFAHSPRWDCSLGVSLTTAAAAASATSGGATLLDDAVESTQLVGRALSTIPRLPPPHACLRLRLLRGWARRRDLLGVGGGGARRLSAFGWTVMLCAYLREAAHADEPLHEDGAEGVLRHFAAHMLARKGGVRLRCAGVRTADGDVSARRIVVEDPMRSDVDLAEGMCAEALANELRRALRLLHEGCDFAAVAAHRDNDGSTSVRIPAVNIGPLVDSSVAAKQRRDRETFEFMRQQQQPPSRRHDRQH